MRTPIALGVAVLGIALVAAGPSWADDDLRKAFLDPPTASKSWCYWWWLNGAASKEGITRDFEEMQKQGIAGALLFDAGEAGAEAPRGPRFMSPPWRALYQHALREADRCGIALSVNLCSGWNAGGPWVTAKHAAKKLVAASTVVKGPGRVTVELPRPEQAKGFYRDLVVLARPDDAGGAWQRSRMIDLTKFVPHGRFETAASSSNPQSSIPNPSQDAVLNWDAPPGTWTVLRIGCTLHGKTTQCVGSGPGGLEIDTMSAAAMDAHFAETGAKLIADAGPLVGKTLQYFHIDSWELGQPTWTPRMREEFHKRRGYDPLFYLPAVLGQTVDSPEVTRRFLTDYRRTAADLVAANYYGRLRELTLQGGLRGTHPESGGPFFDHWIDALQCEGINDIPMGEFWKRNAEPAGPITWPPQTNPTIKQIASAAHIYGKPVCQAEAYTSFACDWTADPWTMKDIGDEAFCHGLTRNVLCFWVHQPRLDARPGYQWAHVGTHFDCNVTWWPMSHGWLTYLARCQHLLRRGLFVADFAYLQDEEIPGFIAPRDKQQPALPAGYDYDVINAEALLTRASVRDGRLVLPDGMSYRYLVLPQRAPLAVSPTVLKRIKGLIESGATVVSPKPAQAVGLSDYPRCDEEVKRLADAMWGTGTVASGERKLGAGRLIWGPSLDDVATRDNLPPDFKWIYAGQGKQPDWIHRRDGQTDIYFVANLSSDAFAGMAGFRTSGKQPELWDAVTGEIRDLPDWFVDRGCTIVPFTFLPRQSAFIVFRRAAEPHKNGETRTNFPRPKLIARIDGPWQVTFDPRSGGPGQVEFVRLDDWTARPEEGIRYYSGTAIYRKRFDAPTPLPKGRLYVDLGTVKNVARAKLNGRELGVVWTAPWHIEVTDFIRPGANDLEIEVANLWPNRLIGDGLLPKDKRRTQTNVKTYEVDKNYPTYGCQVCAARRKTGKPPTLLPSGLIGPVTLLVQGNGSCGAE